MKKILLFFLSTIGFAQVPPDYTKIGSVNPPTPVMSKAEFEKELKAGPDSTRYRPGFTYTNTTHGRVEKITLLRWILIATSPDVSHIWPSSHRWKCRNETMGLVAEHWTDDHWIDEALGKKH